jgi:hypothetical protein
MWLFLMASISMPAAISAAVVPVLLVSWLERALSPRKRIALSWGIAVGGAACAHFAVHSPFWL